MAVLNGEIKGYVAGDDIEIRRSITNIPGGQTLSFAWFTVKTQPTEEDVTALIQKVIGTTNNVGVGQIENVGGSLSNTGEIRFDLVGVDTSKLQDETVRFYDIQVKTTVGKVYTPESGKIKLKNSITKAV